MSTPAPVPPATPPPSTPLARTLSQEAVDLATYRIAENVSEKFNKRATFWFAVIGLASALGVWLGIDAVKVSVTRDVEDKVTSNIEKDIKPLTDRARSDLVDNEVLVGTIKKQSLDAQAKLETVNQAAAKLDALSANSAKLVKDFNRLNDRLTVATEQTNRAISGLRAAQLDLSAGRPSIVSWDLFKPTNGATSTIQGTNFGNEPGTISIRVAYRHELTADMTYLPPLAYTDWIPVDALSIAKWSNTMINLKFSEAFLNKFRASLAKLKLGEDSPNTPPEIVNYRIQTKAGKVNEIQ